METYDFFFSLFVYEILPFLISNSVFLPMLLAHSFLFFCFCLLFLFLFVFYIVFIFFLKNLSATNHWCKLQINKRAAVRTCPIAYQPKISTAQVNCTCADTQTNRLENVGKVFQTLQPFQNNLYALQPTDNYLISLCGVYRVENCDCQCYTDSSGFTSSTYSLDIFTKVCTHTHTHTHTHT